MTKYKSNISNILIGSIFAGFGLIMLIVVIVTMTAWFDFQKTAVPTEATITEITATRYRSNGKTKTRHHVDIEYTYDGEYYDNTLDHYSSNMYEGMTIEIFCDPDNPNHIMSEPYLLCILLSVFVLIFGGIGSAVIISEVKRYIYANKLIAEDKYIYCDEWYEENANVKVNNTRYKNVVCTYHDSYGREYIFTSHPYHPNKCPYYPGQSIKVYVDIEGDASKYYVPTDDNM